ncbi:MAG: phosphatase PAP2 family protein [Bdellovibrionia bacterium]
MEFLTSLDRKAFAIVNDSLSNPFFDAVMPVVTDLHKSWIFVLLGLAGLGLWIWRDRKRAPKILLGLALSVACSETVSYRIIKHYVSRPRPSHTEGLQVNLRTHDHSGESFPSLHASNNFAGATYLSLFFVRLSPVFFAIAALVGFSRVYVGVHFPSDVAAGAVIGILCGLLFWYLTRRFLKVT